MIVLILIQGICGLIISLMSVFPNLPNLPKSILDGLSNFLDLIFNNIGLLGIFLPISTIKVVVPLVILIVNFDKIYKLITWVLKKIPMLGFKQ